MKNILAGEKKYEKGISLISSFLGKEENFDKDELEYIENKKGNQFACMQTLSNYYNKFSSINLLIEKNIKSSSELYTTIAKIESKQKVRRDKEE